MKSSKSNVEVIEGFENIKEYYYSINEDLKEGEEVLVFGARSGNPDFQKAIDFFVNYVHDRSERGIKTKILYNDDVKALGKTYESIPLVQVRYMPLGLITKVGVNIYGNTIDMLNWDDPSNPRVIIIKDRHIADSYREYFNMLWSATVAISELEKKGNFWFPEILFENFVNHSDEKQKVEQKIVDILNEHKPSNLLNIGSGFDTLSKADDFPQSIKDISIVEKNTSYVRDYMNTSKEVIHADFETWETDQKYDAIIASHVLYYFDNKKSAVEKVHNLLSDEGISLFVAHKPTKDYADLKNYVFDKKGKKYEYTYDKLTRTLDDLEIEYKQVDVDCKVSAGSVDELYKVLRLWLEMDLKSYYEFEHEIKEKLANGEVEYINTIFIVRK
ncbi:MAG: class I SAM-dependent methyltransferase [Candidatus Paceibacterota bacterium]